MPRYIDGFVLPILKKNLPAYVRLARIACKIFKQHGAIEYCECIGDDLNLPFGLPFPKGIRSRKGETIVFAYIVYKSRAHRDQVSARAMKDPRMATMPPSMPFDVKRMMVGGFEVAVRA